MAVYAKIDSSKPIKNGTAVMRAPQPNSGEAVVVKEDRIESLQLPSAYATLLDGRYKIGGATGWERPGSNLT